MCCAETVGEGAMVFPHDFVRRKNIALYLTWHDIRVEDLAGHLSGMLVRRLPR